MKRFSLIVFGILSGMLSFSQSLPESDLIDLDEKVIRYEDLKSDTTFFLISSMTCGYCLRDIPFYNSITESLCRHNTKFVVLIENSKEDIVRNKITRTFYNDNWIIIPDAMKMIRKIRKEKVFPEVVVFSDGQQIRSFAYSNSKTHKAIMVFLK